MAEGLYIGMTGAAARAEVLDSVADNLANAQTPGFKAARAAFEAFLPSGGAKDKVYPAAVAAGIDPRPGNVVHTGDPMDLAMEGPDAMLAVRQPSGEVALTRAGRMAVDREGHLLAAGLPVLDAKGDPILVPPETTPSIAPDGQVSANGVDLGHLGLYRLNGPASRLGPQLLGPGPGAKIEALPGAKVRIGEVELGNVSPLEATVQLVNTQRNYDTSMQALQTYKRLDDRIMEVGRIR
jgi:flagellar basal-body rod protein FlgF